MFTAAQTWPFATATFLLIAIAIIEGIALTFGAALSEVVEHHLPNPWDNVHGPFDKALGWLYVGRVPFLVLLVLFLAGFAIGGFALNLVSHRFFGVWVTPWIAAPLAFFAALPFVRVCGAGLARLNLRDQTFAVSFDSLSGRVATIVGGTAKVGLAAQAKVRTEFGQDLYVMVEPDTAGMTFENGESVLLVRQIAGNRFTASLNPHPDVIR